MRAEVPAGIPPELRALAVRLFGTGPLWYTLDMRRRPVPIYMNAEFDYERVENMLRGRDRIVGLHDFGPLGRVSTVFLGLDHRHFGEGPPILWETMIFGGLLDQYQTRYTSEQGAIAGHLHVCRLALFSPFMLATQAVAHAARLAWAELRYFWWP